MSLRSVWRRKVKHVEISSSKFTVNDIHLKRWWNSLNTFQSGIQVSFDIHRWLWQAVQGQHFYIKGRTGVIGETVCAHKSISLKGGAEREGGGCRNLSLASWRWRTRGGNAIGIKSVVFNLLELVEVELRFLCGIKNELIESCRYKGKKSRALHSWLWSYGAVSSILSIE